MTDTKENRALEYALMDLIRHKEKMPKSDFTPSQYREWDSEKRYLLQTVWSATTNNNSREIVRKALQSQAEKDRVMELMACALEMVVHDFDDPEITQALSEYKKIKG